MTALLAILGTIFPMPRILSLNNMNTRPGKEVQLDLLFAWYLRGGHYEEQGD